MPRKKVVASRERVGKSSSRPAPRPPQRAGQFVDPYSWVFEEVRSTPSTIIEDELEAIRVAGVIFNYDVGNVYVLSILHRDDHVCHFNHHASSRPDWLWMYETLFTRLGVRLPFSSFQRDILGYTGCAPLQLYPNT
ncbi:hypothetical protein AHAS_Ahas17G0119600 [Arachis hypogaea]